MKKGILLLLGMFMMVSLVEAKSGEKSTNKIGVTVNYNDAVTFVEKGIQFHVFLNGDFDFNTHYRNNRYYDYNGRRTRSGVRIDRDYRGRIRRVGNVFINYDHRGNVKRIGSVYMKYRFNKLSKVGGLRITYRWGEPHFYGYVKDRVFYDDDFDFGININIGDVCDYDDAYFYRNDFRRNYRLLREDNNFYYYKAKPNARIGKRSKVLKRRKPVSKNKVYKKRKTKKKTYKSDGIYDYKKREDSKRRVSRQ